MARVILPYYSSNECKFHAGGREDVDVRMLGNGILNKANINKLFIFILSNFILLITKADLLFFKLLIQKQLRI